MLYHYQAPNGKASVSSHAVRKGSDSEIFAEQQVQYIDIATVTTVGLVTLILTTLTDVASYPNYTPVLQRAVELWCHDPTVTTPILKLTAELAQNR